MRVAGSCFNSFMVQLKACNRNAHAVAGNTGFNSFMVQLKGIRTCTFDLLYYMFQFLHGTIKSVVATID